MIGRRPTPSTAGASITPALRSARLPTLAALLSLASCHLEDRRALTLQLSTNGACVRTSVACGGEVGVFVTDGKTGDVLDSACVPFAADAAMTLEKLPAALAGFMPPLPALASGQSVVVEVDVYSPASGKSCPRFSPDVGGNVAVPSYFGRSTAAAVGASPSIPVALQCFPTSCLPCAKHAAPTGTDPPDGGVADAGVTTPFKTAARLVASLTPGQVGCLEDGTYEENVTFAKTGNGANPITLAAAPGAHPVLKGVVTIPDTTDYITLANLVLDGAPTVPPVAPATRSASPLVRGDHVALRGNDITNAGADCVVLGDQTFGIAKLTVVEDNRIHGCRSGVVAKIAESAAIAHNTIFDNTADGVALTPNAVSATVEHNVIDGNGTGVLFGSDGKVSSINDVVRTSVISGSTPGYDVDSSFPGVAGTGNSATENCFWMGAKGDVVAPTKGFSAKNNMTIDPMYLDRANKDFRLAPTSPCKAYGPLR